MANTSDDSIFLSMDSRIRGNDGPVRSPVADHLTGEAQKLRHAVLPNVFASSVGTIAGFIQSKGLHNASLGPGLHGAGPGFLAS
jgi:hypothetical protein